MKATGCSISHWESGTSWSDLKDNSDDGKIIESKDSVDGQSSPERFDDASSIVKNQTTSADDELTVSSGEESDSKDSSEHDSNDLMARSLFAGKNGRVWFATCLPPSRTCARNLRHTNEDQLVLQKPSKIKLMLLLALLMKICLSMLSNTLTSVQGGTSEKEAKIQMNGCHLVCNERHCRCSVPHWCVSLSARILSFVVVTWPIRKSYIFCFFRP